MDSKVTQGLLAVIAAALVVLAVRPYAAPSPVQAQTAGSSFWFEPGVFMLRMPNGGQVLGKVGVDLDSGNVWGLPTGTNDPYPASPIDNKPQVSHPIPLGKFALGEVH